MRFVVLAPLAAAVAWITLAAGPPGVGVVAVAALVSPRVRPRAVAGLAGVALAAFTLANPDRLIARWNIDRWERTGRLEVAALSGLSADAVPS